MHVLTISIDGMHFKKFCFLLCRTCIIYQDMMTDATGSAAWGDLGDIDIPNTSIRYILISGDYY